MLKLRGQYRSNTKRFIFFVKESNLILFILLLPLQSINAQSKISELEILFSNQLKTNYLATIESKSKKLHPSINEKAKNALLRLKRQELKIAKELLKVDSISAQQYLAGIEENYSQLNLSDSDHSFDGYNPDFDTISCSFLFLEKLPAASGSTSLGMAHLESAKAQVDKLKTAFSRSSYVQNFMKERKDILRQYLKTHTVEKYLKRFNKEIYYYSQQLQSFRDVLKDKSKVERKVLNYLTQQKSFQQFMSKHSMLASLFRMPDTEEASSIELFLPGLQTRSQVSELIQQSLGAAGPNANQQFNSNIQSAQSQLSQLKDKMQKFGGGSSEAEMPEGFVPNNQKTKSFWKRLQYGTNIQSQRASGFFPVTSDIGLSVGYKLNDKSLIGFGTSYKLGWGRSIQNMRITHQGVGLRTFVDWKLKKSLWVSGGYEMNYRTQITEINQLRDYSSWQRSGLLGVSKQIPIKTRFFKNSKIMLLWDFLSYNQRPRTQPLLVRIGYNF